ncbi:sugar O-acetyltransferase [Streptomyces sp. ISL-22]|uniref:maltose acetyltransferase domain-containing protein n=1 Tax=unclassified Streptomyces TaxID=2593676 RepID=UPI001BE55E21|nr:MULTISPECIES: maltose acetyltransferase domain-containing protein [unclassified Streptomyces]MBT2423849.1 sugar O-acetyltransferase [Streptomyces sp. ISL-24]MBT2435754.1 sugar O-acetyltransferase [Streptomyces sp. ISL-22]
MSTDYFTDDPRSNLERMLAGDLYIADDPEIARRQQRAVRLAARYQAAYAEDVDAARPLLAELLGSLGDEAHVRPRLYVDYGSNITIGARTFVNHNLTALDVAAITIGDNCVIGAGAVVTKDVPANVVAVGNPARPVRRRSPHAPACPWVR